MNASPHIEAAGKNATAETILLPGDPLRAKFIAENFLDNPVQFNGIRSMLGYTGEYKGKKVSVMGTGMGIPSIAIYSYELIHMFGVKNLIRIGSCGSLQKDIDIYDIVLCMGASTDSNYYNQYNLNGSFSAIASYELLSKAVEIARAKQINVKVGNVLTTDTFYNTNKDQWLRWADMGVLAVEMETAALYANALRANADALSILTVSDSLVSKKVTSATERERNFTEMINIALELSLKT